MRFSVEAPGQAPAPAGLFRAVWRQSLIYNQCWEDPALDREALRLTPEDRVMVITSAGCNAIDYALSGAAVLAVDANPRQNHLLELKLAAYVGSTSPRSSSSSARVARREPPRCTATCCGAG